MTGVTALGFEYANRTDNTFDGLTATREKLAEALSQNAEALSQNNELQTQNIELQSMLNNVMWVSGSVVVVLLVVIVVLAATRHVTVVASA
jgi:cellobiose-specific phosphotransferase system component IIC